MLHGVIAQPVDIGGGTAKGLSLFAVRADAVLALLTEIPAAFLLVLETCLLFGSVVARYVFHRPIIWSDELASILFLWLAMLGATIALRHNSHMRLTLFVGRAASEMQEWLEAAGAVVVAAFLALILLPAFEYAADERFITTPALDMPNSWRTSAIAVCAVLMTAVVLLRLAESVRPSRLLGAAVV